PEDGDADAVAVGELNIVNGHLATDEDFVVLNGNLDTGNVFTAAGTPTNAVQVTITQNIQYFFGVFGTTFDTYTKVATATLAPLSRGTPNARDATGPIAGSLPFAITDGDALFPPNVVQTDCTNLPVLTNAPAGNINTMWTSFTDSPPPAVPDLLVVYLPAACVVGAPMATPQVAVGQVLNSVPVNPVGSDAALLAAIGACFNAGLTTF